MALGWLLEQIGDHEASLAALNTASKLRPVDPTVQHALGELFFDIGEWDASVQAFERALAASSGPAEARAIESKLDKAQSRAIGNHPSTSQ
jgi:tetratricopeptide (TPR) repeat protein